MTRGAGRLLFSDPEAFRRACGEARSRGETVGLVPTMGALHDGHMALVREARRRAQFVVVSVFVNPTQFGPHEDLDRYPRRLEADRDRSAESGADGVFAPEPGAMYPEGDQARVRVQQTSAALCGLQRQGHFEGVATVVTKLLCLAGPCVAVFGRKDYQQLAVIRRLTTDLFLPAEIVGVPTVREPDGLAMSSRNQYLSKSARQAALAIPRGLGDAVRAFDAGERRVGELRQWVLRPLSEACHDVDYVSIADPDTIEVLEDGIVGDRALLALAARFDGARLIDNVVLGEDAAPIGAPADQRGTGTED